MKLLLALFVTFFTEYEFRSLQISHRANLWARNSRILLLETKFHFPQSRSLVICTFKNNNNNSYAYTHSHSPSLIFILICLLRIARSTILFKHCSIVYLLQKRYFPQYVSLACSYCFQAHASID